MLLKDVLPLVDSDSRFEVREVNSDNNTRYLFSTYTEARNLLNMLDSLNFIVVGIMAEINIDTPCVTFIVRNYGRCD